MKFEATLIRLTFKFGRFLLIRQIGNILYDPGRITGHNCTGRDILDHHRAGSNQGILTDYNTRQNCDVRSNLCPPLYEWTFKFSFTLGDSGYFALVKTVLGPIHASSSITEYSGIKTWL